MTHQEHTTGLCMHVVPSTNALLQDVHNVSGAYCSLCMHVVLLTNALPQGVQDVLGGLGLGVIASQLADLQLGELLDTPPPGLDEAVAIAKVGHITARLSRFARHGHSLMLFWLDRHCKGGQQCSASLYCMAQSTFDAYMAAEDVPAKP